MDNKDKFGDEIYSSIKSYFNTLSHSGYKPYKEAIKLSILIFLEELLYGPMSVYITDDDYRAITKALYCLYGTCMIPFPAYLDEVAEVQNSSPNKYRISEDGILRVTEGSQFRSVLK